MSIDDPIDDEEIDRIFDELDAASAQGAKWDRRFMDVAGLVALRSKDSTRVGAVLVGPENEIRLTSFA